jgi:hypothetical protein
MRKTVSLNEEMKQWIEDYRVKNNISTWEGALWELVRKGLNK